MNVSGLFVLQSREGAVRLEDPSTSFPAASWYLPAEMFQLGLPLFFSLVEVLKTLG